MCEKLDFLDKLKRRTLPVVYEYQIGLLVDLAYDDDYDDTHFSLLLHFLVGTYGEAFYFDFARRVKERRGHEGDTDS